MGATLSTESVFTATVLVAAFAFGYHHYATSLSNGNTGYKRPNRSEENKLGPLVSPVSSTSSVRSTMPGQFDQTPNHSLSSKSKKSKKKKKSQCSGTELDTTLQPSTNLPPTSTRYSQPLQPSTVVSGDADGSRTHVIPGRKAEKKGDAGIMPPVTEGLPLDPETVSKHAVIVKRLSSKAPKTGVDDMLPEQPPLARVIRVHPLPNEEPPRGFTWDNYDNVQISDGREDNVDGEDGGEWGVVENKRARIAGREGQASVSSQRPMAKTKKQRQNANRREAGKAASAAAETDRLARLAKHKHGLEQIRIMEQSRSSKKSSKSGGMTSGVDDRGKLVWE